jgi:hypothetical protein
MKRSRYREFRKKRNIGLWGYLMTCFAYLAYSLNPKMKTVWSSNRNKLLPTYTALHPRSHQCQNLKSNTFNDTLSIG